MKFSVGDKVLMKHTEEEGVITRILNEEMVEVDIDGISIPAYIDEIEHPYLNWFLSENIKNKIRQEKEPISYKPEEKIKIAHLDKGFHLAFSTIFKMDFFDEVVDFFKIYFVNQTPHKLTLTYQFLTKHGLVLEKEFKVPVYDYVYLHDIAFDQMNDQPKFSCHLFQDRDKNLQEHFGEIIKLKAKTLFSYISKIQKDKEKLFTVPIADNFPVRTSFEEEKKIKNIAFIEDRSSNKNKKSPIHEIDLHYEKLDPDRKERSNFEILQLQLSTLEDAIEQAIQFNQLSLIVIHGVGKGKLKEEIHSLLRSYPEIDFFQHEWMPKYGYGATEIFFKQ